jgi:glyoxylase-like metal-dependent hydrolase (beta-lactamase superfamily II)
MTAQTVIPVVLGGVGPRGLRSFVVTGDRPFLVDTGVPGSAPAILAALAEAGIEPTDIALIVITHAHIDHAGAAEELQRTTGAPVLAHPLDAAALATGASEPVVGRTPAAQAFAEQIAARRADAPAGPAYAPVAATSTGDDGADLSAEYGIDARAIHTPGHTRGGLTVLLGNGEALVGDLVDRVDDAPALAGFAVDENAMAESIARVLASGATVVHTCHGGSFDRAQMLAAFGS